MAEATLPQKAETCETRGLALARERGEEIEHLGRGRFLVPGCSGGGPYDVQLAILGNEESCTCPDFTTPRRGREDGQPCKHLYAATVVRAKRQARVRREAEGRRRGRARGGLSAMDPAALDRLAERMGVA